jgi:hypothetical protein
MVLILLLSIAGFLAVAAVPCMAQQQANLSDIGNTTVTLYYYDNTNETKGAIVPMPDNPQDVNLDPAIAAPGMYTFSHVPSGRWYYLEADHDGNKWFTVFFMEEGVGTKTANVHIPPLTPVNASMPSPSPSPSPSASFGASPTATPHPTGMLTPVASPGMTIMAAISAIIAAITLMALKRQ